MAIADTHSLIARIGSSWTHSVGSSIKIRLERRLSIDEALFEWQKCTVLRSNRLAPGLYRSQNS
jgi:hypothetical protein